ncbi:MAG: SH3 domain-containing protein [Bacteroidales bacterium]|nr:SH3 domain-containing protein [Bacteroidales bacterium]
MKKTLLLTILLAVAATAAASPADEAAALYSQSRYGEALDLYLGLLGEGYGTAELYYNIGNTYYRMDSLGRAILFYRRALALKPGMDDARQNLALAESRTVDRITPLPRPFLASWADALLAGVSPATWRLATLLLAALLCAALVVMRLGSRRGLRKAALIVAAVAALLFAAALALSLATASRRDARRDAVVLPQSVAVKSSPSQQGTDVMILHEGTLLTVTDSLSGWYKTRLADGSTGWCPAQAIERI